MCVRLCVAKRSLLRRDGNSVTAGVHVSVCDGVYVLACVGLCVCVFLWYWVATISRLLKIIGLFCKRTLQKRLHSANEAYNLIDPTDRSHPIERSLLRCA